MDATSSGQAASDPDSTLSDSERSAVRAYLQRSEVRLSTVHRVATALLSGAGLMVLLPVVGRDAVVDVVRHLFTGRVGLTHGLLAVGVLATLTVPVVSLLVLLRDLTEFYFHSNHVGSMFAPRFTLTGLRLPEDDLGSHAREVLDRERTRSGAVHLLVPDNDKSRARHDARLDAYGLLDGRTVDAGVADSDSDDAAPADLARAEALFALAASRSLPLLGEVAKIEHGMARHVLRIQVIVLRYVKALLALLTTALAVFAAAAVADGKSILAPADEAWLAAVLLIWAPTVVAAVSTPVRWLDRLLRREGATDTAVTRDAAFTQIEDVAVSVALVGFAAATAVMAISLAHESTPLEGRLLGGSVTVLTAAWLATIVRDWARGARWRRLLARRSKKQRREPTT